MLLAALTFLARLQLAGWNSYWLDELYSVGQYVSGHDSVIEAIRDLAETSIHPPLYQALLYFWVQLFGDGEAATRTLSNLYMTLATVFLYLLVREVWSRRVAFLSALAFSVMYTPTYYGLETRSYAQTMFLVALSSFLLLRLLNRTTGTSTWRTASTWVPTVLLAGTNTALLMTHYYNVFWLMAQALFVVLYSLRERPRHRWPSVTTELAVLYVVPALVFWITWGGVFSRQISESSTGYEIDGDGPELTAVDLLLDFVVRQNIDPPTAIGWLGAALAIGLVVWAVIAIIYRRVPLERREPWTVLYLATWLVLPLVMVVVAFAALGIERYSSRYFVSSVMPLAPLLILAIEKTAQASVRRMGWLIMPMATAITMLVIITFVLPLGHDAATLRKTDYRGIVQQVNDVVRLDDGSSYIIYETSFRRDPVTDFYFDKLPGNISAHDTLQRHEERRGRYRILDRADELISDHDYLVVIFVHSATTDFPNAMERLMERYEVRHRQLDNRGLGFIVFETGGR